MSVASLHLTAEQRRLLRERVDAAMRERTTPICPNGYTKGTTGYRKGCRCRFCTVETSAARLARKHRQAA